MISVQPVLNQVELGTVLKAFDMPQMLTGKFSMKGDLTGDRLSYRHLSAAGAVRRSWRCRMRSCTA